MRGSVARNKLIKLLQKAHAGELAAYHAYVGHMESLKGTWDELRFRDMISDELVHQILVLDMLEKFGAKPDPLRDKIFIWIGKTAGFLCHYTGYILPMVGAWILERIGSSNYIKMSKLASECGEMTISAELMDMACTEIEHEFQIERMMKHGRQ